MDTGLVEQIETPPDDGMTIDGAEATATDSAALPPSRLPAGQQFDVLSRWWRADSDHSSTWRKNARYWFGFRAGDQWTDDDKALLEQYSRPVIVFNRVLTILKAVAGMQINGRHEVQFAPRDTEDTKVNEVLNGASRWMADGCDAANEESQAFDNCATCGMGWGEQRMSYLRNPAGMYVEESVDPLEMYWDRTAKKRNLSDARRMSRVRRMPIGDAMRMFPGFTADQLNAVWAQDSLGDYPVRSLEEKWKRDGDNSLLQYDDLCEVTIVQIQWIEIESYWLVADPATNSKAELSDAQYKVFASRMEQFGMPVHAVKLEREVYKQAFLGAQGTMLRKAGPAPIKGQFTWKCITGEFDALTRTWFGLVKLLRDPQMWANKWLSQILHILNTTAKGGILAERSAFDDEREAEDTYAQPDDITWLADGALSGDKPKLMPKPGGGMTEGYIGLLTFAISSFKDVSGINLELLGQQDQNQPGVLEAMRKQAGMTVLATLFDSLALFHKDIGHGRLYFIQNFLSDGRLIRVSDSDGKRAVRLAKDVTVGEYDVVVQDAPTSPNQKEANWLIIQPLIVAFKDQLVANPKVFAMLLEYSPLPSRIVDTIKEFIDAAENDPAAQEKRQRQEQIVEARQIALIHKDESAALLNEAKAGGVQSDAAYNMVIAQNLLYDNDFEGLRQHISMMEAHSKAKLNEAKAERERVGVVTDVEDVNLRRQEAAENAKGQTVARLIDHMAAVAGAERDHAAAQKDRVAAHRDARTPSGPAAMPT